MKTKDYSLPKEGDVFGRLTVVSSYLKKTPTYTKTYVVCDCACGATGRHVSLASLRKQNTLSCGCLQKERASQANKTHGQSNSESALYRRWSSMRSRCKNPNTATWKNYGGRGISVCESWDRDFLEFQSWCLANGYIEGLEIDRIDNDGDYEPNNCRFVSTKENARNKRTNRILTHNGVSLPLCVWAEKIGIEQTALCQRISRGWSVSDALDTPITRGEKRLPDTLTAFGETKSVVLWAKDIRCKVSYDSLRTRIVDGWDSEAAIETPVLRRPQKKH